MVSIVAISPSHFLCADLAIAAANAGEMGILNLGFGAIGPAQLVELGRLRLAAKDQKWGIRWDSTNGGIQQLMQLLDALEAPPGMVILSGFQGADLPRSKPQPHVHFYLEVTSLESAIEAEGLVDGWVFAGNEAGGRVGADSTYITLQKVAKASLSCPFYIRGGIGPDTAAAAMMCGATGIVLEEQLWLAKESPFDAVLQRHWRKLDGSQTECLGKGSDLFRVYTRTAPEQRELIRKTVSLDGPWKSALEIELSHKGRAFVDSLICLGQDIALASYLAQQCVTVAGIFDEYRQRMSQSIRLAAEQATLLPKSSFAESNGIEYPILQGPMTRVSDVPEFCFEVQNNGALPFLALSLMKAPQVEKLLAETQEKLDGHSWGVGILGFVPNDLRREQLDVIRRYRPTHAIVAGGRPSYVRELESIGIATFLHCPSPNLLASFLADGCRRYIFEGRECGGHVGPRSSFALWQCIVTLLEQSDIRDPLNLEVVFAGGIHDSLSAAMASVIAAPLVKRGVKVAILMGTSYLFTPESVASGAITQEYQLQAIACRRTALLESGIGHATRAVDSPFVAHFETQKQRLISEGNQPSRVRDELEFLNLGRLRIASKGLVRPPQLIGGKSNSQLVCVDGPDQVNDGLYMIGDVATLRDEVLPMLRLHESVTVDAVELIQRHAAQYAVVTPMREVRLSEPIAIVGLGCIFPGSKNIKEFWQNIMLGDDALGPIPCERWDVNTFYDADRFRKDRIYARTGSFIDEILFDPTQYGIPPVSMRSIEPIQLLALEVARQALSDANFEQSSFPRERTAVIFAVAGLHDLGIAYALRTGIRQQLASCAAIDASTRDEVLRELECQLPEWSEDSFAGFLLNVVAGRVANRFDLRGTNHTVDAACASSLAALQTAMEQLRNHTCDAALVGAVDGTNNPFTYMSFAKTQALSPNGHSNSLDDRADGIALGEGLGAFVLKRLSDAEKSGDTIHAVIRGIGSSSDGRNRSMTAPYAQGQLLALERAYEDAQVAPRTVSLLELHSTGTKVGDAVEVDALTGLFVGDGATRQSCAIGSIKSMIGHTKSAAGMASMLKVIMALKHHVIPPTIGVISPLADVQEPNSPFYIASDLRPWLTTPSNEKRRAGVSCFGFGGTNFHAVFEEYSAKSARIRETDLSPRSGEIFCWWRIDRNGILEALNYLFQQIASVDSTHIELDQLAYSLHLDESSRPLVKTESAACRLAIAANSIEDLQSKLEIALEKIPHTAELNQPRGIFYSEAIPVTAEQVCFVFPGQGSQSINMLRPLVLRHGCMQMDLLNADGLLADNFEQSLSSFIFPRPAYTKAQHDQRKQQLDDTRVAQPSLAAIELSALALMKRFGISAGMYAGHSFGEYTALHAANVLSSDDLLQIAAKRGTACWECQAESTGSMAVVFADEETTTRTLARLRIPASIANINSSRQVVIAGPTAVIKEAVTQLPANGIQIAALPVTAAFHTDAMLPAREKLEAHLQSIQFRAPQGKLFNNTTARQSPPEPEAIRNLLGRHLTEPVRFHDQICAMHAAGGRVFIEVGPGRVLTGLIRQILENTDFTALSIDNANDELCLHFAKTLAQLCTLGIKVRLGSWFESRQLANLGLQEFLASVRASAIRKPTDWLVSSWRARPWPDAQATPEALEPQQPANTGDKPPNSRSPDSAMLRLLEKPSVLGVHSVSELVQATELSRSQLQSQQNSEPVQVDPMTSVPPTNLQNTNGSQPIMTSLISQMQHSLAKWLELQSDNQKMQSRFLDLQQQLLTVMQGKSAEFDLATVVRDAGERKAAQSASMPTGHNGRSQPAKKPPLPSFPPTEVDSAAQSHQAVFQPIVAKTPSKPALHAHPVSNAPPIEQPTQRASNQTPNSLQFREDLLAAISSRTGYPTDMLDEDLELEGGLGIDSIKMVEIFSSLTEYHAYLPGADNQEDRLANFANQKTIRSIIEFYSSMAGSDNHGAVKSDLPDPRSAGNGDSAIERRVLTTSDSPLNGKKKSSQQET